MVLQSHFNSFIFFDHSNILFLLSVNTYIHTYIHIYTHPLILYSLLRMSKSENVGESKCVVRFDFYLWQCFFFFVCLVIFFFIISSYFVKFNLQESREPNLGMPFFQEKKKNCLLQLEASRYDLLRTILTLSSVLVKQKNFRVSSSTLCVHVCDTHASASVCGLSNSGSQLWCCWLHLVPRHLQSVQSLSRVRLFATP